MKNVNRQTKAPTSLIETKDLNVPCQACKTPLRVRLSRQTIGLTIFTKTEVRDGQLIPIEQVANDEPCLFCLICNPCMRKPREAPAAMTKPPSNVVHLDSQPVPQAVQVDLARGKFDHIRRQWRRLKQACLVWLRAFRPSDHITVNVDRKDVDRETHSLGVDAMRANGIKLEESRSVARPPGDA
jgi:hypothetical protein